MQIGTINPYIQVQNIPSAQTDHAKTESGFTEKVMTCVSAGSQKVMLRSDALMSYASPQTGESVNIYRSDRYTKENPIYLLKGLDASGREFSYEVDASKINPNRCSYNELMVLNLETGGNTPENYLHAVMMRDKAGLQAILNRRIICPPGKRYCPISAHLAHGILIYRLINGYRAFLRMQADMRREQEAPLFEKHDGLSVLFLLGNLLFLTILR